MEALKRPDPEELARRCEAAFPSLTEPERRIALATYRTLADAGRAAPDEVARAAGVSTAAVDEALRNWPGVYRDEAGRVVGFWGLAHGPMDHELRVGERTLYGWCALDTLFLPEILGAPAEVRSRCPATGEPVRLRVGAAGPSELDPAEAVVSMIDPDRADVVGDRVLSSFCHHIHFLASRETGERWARERENGAFMLDVDEAWALGGRLNRLRYGELLDGAGAGPV